MRRIIKMIKMKQWQELKKIDPSQIVFLCGSGISLDAPTSLPTVKYFTLETLNLLKTDKKIISEVERKMNSISYRFEVLISYIRNTCDPQLNVVKLFRHRSYNKIHDFIACMYLRGASVITTNFDTCIENALVDHHDLNHDENYLIYQGYDLKDIKNNKHCLIKIHGSHIPADDNYDDLVITIENLAKTANSFSFLPHWKQTLLNLLKDKYIVVLGYSCSDDFDVVPLLHIASSKQIIWFDYDTINPYPLYMSQSRNHNIEDLAASRSLSYFQGQIINMLENWAASFNKKLVQGHHEANYSLTNYIAETCPDFIDQMLLKNVILLNYGMYDDIYFDHQDSRLYLQAIKASFRLNEFSKTIDLCQQLKEKDCNFHLKTEALYFESSAYYRLNQYEKALVLSKEHIHLLDEKKDPYSYFTAFNNYTSIYYVYIWYYDDHEKLREIRKNYLYVIRRAKGINIEAQANAYWGLGDLYKVLDQNKKALHYLFKARETLIQIGNTFALKSLDEVIDSISKITDE